MDSPKAGVKPCCREPLNLRVVQQGKTKQPNGEEVPIEVKQCSVCLCKHYRMFVGERLQPGRVGVS